MRTYDFAPLWRSSIGFDRLFDLINDAQRLDNQDNYPPYDIVRTGEDSYRISLALAGFAPDEIAITALQNRLTISGRRADQEAEANPDHQYLYQAFRPDRSSANSTSKIMSRWSASFENGLLQIELARKIPEAMKPRRIEIGAGHPSRKADKLKIADQVRAVS